MEYEAQDLETDLRLPGLIFASPGSDHGSFVVSALDWENHHTSEPYEAVEPEPESGAY